MRILIHQCAGIRHFPFNIAPKLIKWFQKVNYSHYAISYQMDRNSVLTYCDSTSAGVKRYTPEEFTEHYSIIKTYVCDKNINYDEFFPWFEKHEGKSYGFVQILGLFLKGIKVIAKNPFGGGSKRIICNELVILFLNRFYGAKIVDTDSLDLNDTTRLIERVL